MRGVLLLILLQFGTSSNWAQNNSEFQFDIESRADLELIQGGGEGSKEFDAGTIPIYFGGLTQTWKRSDFDFNKGGIESNEEVKILADTIIPKDSIIPIKFHFKLDGSIPLSDIRLQNVANNTLIDQQSGFFKMPQGEWRTRAIYASQDLHQNHIQYYIDGIPIEFFGSGYSINAVPISLLKEVEIHNKVNPVYLLTDRTGGALNFKTSHEANDFLDVSYSFGSYNTHQISAAGYSRDKKSGLTFRGTAFINYSDNEYRVWKGGELFSDLEKSTDERRLKTYRFHDAFYNMGGKMEFGFTDIEWADKFFVGMFYGSLYDEVQHGASMDVAFGELYYREQSLVPSLVYQKNDLIVKGLDVNLLAAYSNRLTNINDASELRYNWHGKPIASEGSFEDTFNPTYYDDHSFTNRLALDYRLGKIHKFTVSNAYYGLKRLSDNLKTPEVFQTIQQNQEMEKNIVGLSYQNTGIDKRLTSSFFAKYLHYDVNSSSYDYDTDTKAYTVSDFIRKSHNYGYGVVLKYNLNPKMFLQSSIERAVTLPEANQIFGNKALHILPAIGSGDIVELQPEVSTNTFLSFFYKNNEKEDHLFHIGLHLILRNVSDYIQADVKNVDGVDYFFFGNHQKVMSEAVEFQLDYRFLNRIDASVSASYLNARNNSRKNSLGTSNPYFNSRLKNEPYFTMNAGVNYRTFSDIFKQKTRFTFSWNLRFVQKFLNIWEGAEEGKNALIPAQFVNNFGVLYGFPKSSTYLSLEARNVFNTPVYNKYRLELPGRGIYAKILLNL